MPAWLVMKPTNKLAELRLMRVKVGRATAGTVVLLSVAAQSWALDPPQDGRALLAQMAAQGRSLNYDGTFVYIRGNNVGSMRIIHKAGENGGRERLISLSGSAREVVRNGEDVTCFFPGERSVMVERAGPGKLLTGRFARAPEKIYEHYQYTVLGGDRVVGRPTWVVKIAPNVQDRYAYQVWLDSSSSLLLKSEVLGLSNEILEQVLFTTIEFPPDIPEHLLKPATDGQGYTWYKSDARQPTAMPGAQRLSGWRTQWLPEGFSMQERRVHALDESGEPVNHMVYSDGLAAVSVFVEKTRDGQPLVDGLSNFGAVHSFGTKLDGFQITVVGELPAEAIKRVAASVAPSTEPDAVESESEK
jgi:sigma-E factor negative regulatory protein RseB